MYPQYFVLTYIPIDLCTFRKVDRITTSSRTHIYIHTDRVDSKSSRRLKKGTEEHRNDGQTIHERFCVPVTFLWFVVHIDFDSVTEKKTSVKDTCIFVHGRVHTCPHGCVSTSNCEP